MSGGCFFHLESSGALSMHPCSPDHMGCYALVFNVHPTVRHYQNVIISQSESFRYNLSKSSMEVLVHMLTLHLGACRSAKLQWDKRLFVKQILVVSFRFIRYIWVYFFLKLLQEIVCEMYTTRVTCHPFNSNLTAYYVYKTWVLFRWIYRSASVRSNNYLYSIIF